ncbi:sulfite exporter TauE/SafE family protein [Allokutzneria sp. A3M-2-11 16]|uniref:sulfite exporter TauE/SafE family protein n=1 Tax=Allokutzneria sp. A3M-2-11 16 TaxID=2962043 RepID=UPI0020B74B9E|nr:sulfite exporter TauE/SafE family protein [Allokutzneria sp. A3M-2-11 16]MCP3802181.1 sulfite exporter TauE/SafE family protein [Allokutzneria sp. A3M-2-11 16]
MGVGLLVAGLVVLVGALVQGSVGYGLNLLAGPLLALIDPMLVPVPVLMIACVQAALAVAREHKHTDWRGVGWAMVGRLPGNVLGVLAVAALPLAQFNIAIGVSVLICVGLSLLSLKLTPTRPGLVVAGAASGAFGTASSIGGPPIALLYQHSTGPVVRATLGAYFLLASISSVLTLWIAGQVRVEHLGAAAVLLPFMLAGFAVSSPLRKFLRGPRLRYAVLAVAAVSATFLVLRNIL